MQVQKVNVSPYDARAIGFSGKKLPRFSFDEAGVVKSSLNLDEHRQLISGLFKNKFSKKKLSFEMDNPTKKIREVVKELKGKSLKRKYLFDFFTGDVNRIDEIRGDNVKRFYLNDFGKIKSIKELTKEEVLKETHFLYEGNTQKWILEKTFNKNGETIHVNEDIYGFSNGKKVPRLVTGLLHINNGNNNNSGLKDFYISNVKNLYDEKGQLLGPVFENIATIKWEMGIR